MVAAALSKVRWGPNRSVTPDIVSKCLPIYDKFRISSEIMETINNATTLFRQSSPFEHWSILMVISQHSKAHDVLLWLMESMVETMVNNKGKTFSKPDLQKKASPLHLFTLRKKLVEGLLCKMVDTSIGACQANDNLKPALVDVEEVLGGQLAPRATKIYGIAV